MNDIIFDLIEEEKKRQQEGLELIPSENYVSEAVLQAAGSVLTNKYSEGYPSFEGLGSPSSGGTETLSADSGMTEPRKAAGIREEEQIAREELPNFRYYGGQRNVDRIERLAIERACRLFHADHANVQPHCGVNANEAVYYAWCDAGDKILGMSLPAGGHLSHGAKVTRAAKVWQFIGYGVTEDGDIDYEELEEKALAEQPKIILIGYSAFMKIPDFDRVAAIGRKIPGCILMADMAHVAGLIAGGVHPNPLEHGFHVMTTTTHKTLRGPRGGLILSMGTVSSPLRKPEKKPENLPTLIDRAVFPGTQGGPLDHIIAAKAVAFGEALQPEFREYAGKIVANARELADQLQKQGFVLQGGGTENHLILIDMKKSFGIDGKLYERCTDLIGLNMNANSLPSDRSGAFRPSGVRLGTPAVTTRGLGPEEMRQIAAWMKQAAVICQEAGSEEALSRYEEDLRRIREEVKKLAVRFPVPGC